MASDAQINANRRNAQKSTGPRTPEGKAISSRNSLVHGLTSQSHQLPGEDPADLSALRDEYLDHYQPVGPIEAGLVERIALAHYRLNRAARMEITCLSLNVRARITMRVRPDLTPPDQVACCWFAEKDAFAKLGAYEGRLQREISRCIADLKQMRTLRPTNNGEYNANNKRIQDEYDQPPLSPDPAEKTKPNRHLTPVATTKPAHPANPNPSPKPPAAAREPHGHPNPRSPQQTKSE
jgi:hypothetical protein